MEQLDILIAAEQLVGDPADTTQIAHLREDLADLVGPTSHPLIDEFLDSFARFHTRRLAAAAAAAATANASPAAATIAALIARKSTEQRTPAWYIQASTILTASELGNLFGSPRLRGQLVMSKAVPPTAEEIQKRCSKPLTCPSEFMSPFDWGIRFEPVVKQIYEQRYAVQIADLGRLVHPTDPRIAASPDGLVSVAADPASPRLGTLIEIKCPISRDLEDKVPADYYTQMQLQLEVTGLDVCYYVEARFRSPCSARNLKNMIIGPAIAEGVLWLVEHQDPTTGFESRRYVYGPVGCTSEEPPCHLISQHDVVIERVPWELMAWNEIEVRRGATWWSGLQGPLTAFWEDVERAKKGEFVVPAARVQRKARLADADAEEETCLINIPNC